MKRAFVTGVTGQDGSYLADLLLEKGYSVYGLVRRNSTDNKWRIQKALSKGLMLVDGDVTDSSSLQFIFNKYGPFDEVYNLAAQSDVGLSWQQPVSTAQITGIGCMNMIEAFKNSRLKGKFYQASTSELFGGLQELAQNELTPFHPRSPYGCAKAFAHYTTINYRESYDLFACCGILFNHESPRRGENFVTQKVIKAAQRIKAGQQKELRMGNLDSRRDWSHAKDMVEGMWLMLQQEEPEEYVLASGRTYYISEFVEKVFKKLDMNWEDYVVIDPAFIRPAEVHLLCGDSTKAREKLHWDPKYPDLDSIIDDMLAGE